MPSLPGVAALRCCIKGGTAQPDEELCLCQEVAQQYCGDTHDSRTCGTSAQQHGSVPHAPLSLQRLMSVRLQCLNPCMKRRSGIRANYLALGWLATPGEHQTMLSEGLPSDWLTAADNSHPFGRILRPWDVGKLAVHLVSDDSQLLTAACIDMHEQFFGSWE